MGRVLEDSHGFSNIWGVPATQWSHPTAQGADNTPARSHSLDDDTRESLKYCSEENVPGGKPGLRCNDVTRSPFLLIQQPKGPQWLFQLDQDTVQCGTGGDATLFHAKPGKARQGLHGSPIRLRRWKLFWNSYWGTIRQPWLCSYQP